MKSVLIKDIMVALEDYATVSEEATLYEAVNALEEAQKRFDENKYRHRAVLVYDSKGNIIGKLSQLDVLKSLEPKYDGIGDLKGLSRYGVDAERIRHMIKEYGLWRQPLDNICRKAATVKVKEIVRTPSQGEYIEENATLNEAIHHLIIGQHQSLLVKRGNKIVGLLRLTDVFKEITTLINTCEI
ncbi:MAG TPA: CBS domain-containing protein [Desulfobacteraceae bacterium]|jgi:CBS domain-containing protein|nr:CBS domain-containing protein [Desulfobacteraceae bacterium]